MTFWGDWEERPLSCWDTCLGSGEARGHTGGELAVTRHRTLFPGDELRGNLTPWAVMRLPRVYGGTGGAGIARTDAEWQIKVPNVREAILLFPCSHLIVSGVWTDQRYAACVRDTEFSDTCAEAPRSLVTLSDGTSPKPWATRNKDSNITAPGRRKTVTCWARGSQTPAELREKVIGKRTEWSHALSATVRTGQTSHPPYSCPPYPTCIAGKCKWGGGGFPMDYQRHQNQEKTEELSAVKSWVESRTRFLFL